MTMRILIDGREVHNPLIRFVVVIFVAVVAAALVGVGLLVLLPLTGVVVASWLVFVGTVVGFVATLAAFALRRSLFTPHYGSSCFRDERRRIRDNK